MGKRKKRLEKGIVSIEKQIKIHEEKKEGAVKEGRTELAGYYDKEIGRMWETREKKKRQLSKL